ncbi:MAG: class I SAM-dependent methyltransferase [Rhodospirillales bacterium]|nr:class I SAM-dependent methyltransferase [Rhodospirillales bacterium]
MGEELDKTFGFEDVEPQERQKRVRQVFQAVAGRYDLMNDVMSFGIHRLWKRLMARRADPKPEQVIVDLAGGTGDVAALMGDYDRSVIVCDPSSAMMTAGVMRGHGPLTWVAGSGEALPFPDNSVDTLTIAFGLRNVTQLDACLSEIHRVLKPGGRMLCLEFSKPMPLIKPFYDFHSFHIIPRLGAWIAKQPIAYTYLVESIRKFPDQKELVDLMETAGFKSVRYCNLSFGIACLHVGEKG